MKKRTLVSSKKEIRIKNKTLLVDGNYLLKMAYSVTKHDYFTPNGHIGAIFQFMMSLRMAIRELGVTKVVVVWDGENGGKLRHNISRDYKGNRSGKSWYNKIQLSDAEIAEQEKSKRTMLAQKVRICQYLEELFIRQIEVPLIEGDDLIAQYCKEFHQVEDIVIYSNDRDMHQLMDYDGVEVYYTKRKKNPATGKSETQKIVINKDNYFLEYKHHYKNARLIKVICGDAGDNIFGICGVQETTLLNNFPEIKEREVTWQEVVARAAEINQTRITSKPKKKPLVALENIAKGVICKPDEEPEEMGEDIFELNYVLVNLFEPFLNEEAIEEVQAHGTCPLGSESRGSKYLLPLMNDDFFFSHFTSGFNKFCEDFIPVILNEKAFEKEQNTID